VAIFDTSILYQSNAFRIAESVERFDRICKCGELAGDTIVKTLGPSVSTRFGAAAELQSRVQSLLEPIQNIDRQLQLSEAQLQIATAPRYQATERLNALLEAININISFGHLRDTGAFTQIRRFEELIGDRILKFDEDHFANKIALSNSFEPIGAGFKTEAGFIPYQPFSVKNLVWDFGKPHHTYRAFGDQSSLFDYEAYCRARQTIEPWYHRVPDYHAIIADKNLSLEERGRAFALSGLPFCYWSDYFLDEDFASWVEVEVETAKGHRERILCLVNKINQIYRRASRIVLQAYRRLTKRWKNASVFSWRYADLNQINTLKDAEIKLSHFFISITSRYSRVSSFSCYEFRRKHDPPPAGYRF
jgi:hypothetical protein